MSRQVGYLYRSISHPANLQNPIHIIPLFAFPPTESPHINKSSCMDSDTYSDIPVFNTISQFNKSDIETPDEFANYEPSPPAFSQPPFDLFTPSTKMVPPRPFLIFPKQLRHTPLLPMIIPTTIPQKQHKFNKN